MRYLQCSLVAALVLVCSVMSADACELAGVQIGDTLETIRETHPKARVKAVRDNVYRVKRKKEGIRLEVRLDREGRVSRIKRWMPKDTDLGHFTAHYGTPDDIRRQKPRHGYFDTRYVLMDTVKRGTDYIWGLDCGRLTVSIETSGGTAYTESGTSRVTPSTMMVAVLTR